MNNKFETTDGRTNQIPLPSGGVSGGFRKLRTIEMNRLTV